MFLSSEALKQLLPRLILNAQDNRVKYGRIELRMGEEYFLTGNDTLKRLSAQEQLTIPSGQFAMLLSEEKIQISNEHIGLISIRTDIKFRGLVNVSGFHVDPGFRGHLKFSVYNAGSKDIVVQRGKPLFLLWLCTLDQRTNDTRPPDVNNTDNRITADDVMFIQGDVASPQQLKKEIEKLQGKFADYAETSKRYRERMIFLIIGLILTVLVTSYNSCMDSLRSSGQGQRDSVGYRTKHLPAIQPVDTIRENTIPVDHAPPTDTSK